MGFGPDLRSAVFDHIQSVAHAPITVEWEYFCPANIRRLYPLIDFVFDTTYLRDNWPRWFGNHRHEPRPQVPQTLLCCFNHHPHVGRQLLLAALWRRGMYDPKHMSKHFSIDAQKIDGYVGEYCAAQDQPWLSLMVDPRAREFYQSINALEPAEFQEHHLNLPGMLPRVRSAWLNLVSETISTSYVPFITEKFLYSVVSRGLFLAYAQPGWHQQLQDWFGFRGFTTLFDYAFDKIANPIHRVCALLDQIQRFSAMSMADLHDLRLLQRDVVDHNHDHFFSGAWLRHLLARVDQATK